MSDPKIAQPVTSQNAPSTVQGVTGVSSVPTALVSLPHVSSAHDGFVRDSPSGKLVATGGGGEGGYKTVQVNGVSLAQEETLNLEGSDLTGSDVGDVTTVHFASSGGGDVTKVFGRDGVVVAVAADYLPAKVGGYVPVLDLTARDGILNSVRQVGTTAYVAANDHLYRLIGGIANTNWVDVTIGLVSQSAAGIAPAFPAGNTVLQSDGTTPGFNASLRLGTTPAVAGTIRLSAESSIAFRAVGSAQDIHVFRTSNDTNNTIILGDSGIGAAVSIQSGNAINLNIAGTSVLTFDSASLFVIGLQMFFSNVANATIANANVAGTGATDMILRAAGTTGPGFSGGTARVQSGHGGSGGDLNGGVALELNIDDTAAHMQSMVEARHVAVGRRATGLNLAAPLTTTLLPANSGDLVTLIGNAATNPTAAPTGGFTLFSKAGNPGIYTPNANKTTIGATGAAAVLPVAPVAYLPINWNGADLAIPLYNP